MNVYQLDKSGAYTCVWCFFPSGGLVVGDVMLAQKLAIELYEDEALASANRLLCYLQPNSRWPMM